MAPQKPKCPIESILVSKPFTFIVGIQKKEFMVHKNLVASLSKSLDQLLNGRMKEAREHCVFWEGTDEKTFLRFAEWAYTGDYTHGEPEILLSASQISTSAQAPAHAVQEEPKPYSIGLLLGDCNRKFEGPLEHCGYDWSSISRATRCDICVLHFNTQTCAKCGRRRYRQCPGCRKGPALKSATHQILLKFTAGKEYMLKTAIQKPRKNKESCEDYTEVFLSHAKLYVLADKYDIPELRSLALHYLHATLLIFELCESRFGDVFRLVKYSFTNTVENDKLRSLLVDYCRCFIKQICERSDFQDLVNEHPDFGYHMMKEMGRHMN